jgi:hypothetical protein
MSRASRIYLDKNTVDSHQINPGWVVTVLRWSNRTSSEVFPSISKVSTRRPLVIQNDVVQINTQNSKQTITPGFSCILKGGDLNYATAIAPGDLVFINIVENEEAAREIADQARSLKQINKVNYGFKGIYKVKGSRRVLQQGENGSKVVAYKAI